MRLPGQSGGSAEQHSQEQRSFLRDERAIEGLPIRLVIALVVGVAALALMMSLLGQVGTVGQTEVTVELNSNDEVIYTDEVDGSSTRTVTMNVKSEDGEPVTDGRVMVTAGSAQLRQPQTAQINDNGQVSITFDDSGDNEIGLRSDQNKGTLKIEVLPPSDSDYTDSLDNSDIILIDGSP